MYNNYKVIGSIDNEDKKATLLKNKNKSEFFVGINGEVKDVIFYNLNDCYNYANEELDIMPDIKNIDMFKSNLKIIKDIFNKIIKDINNPLFFLKMLKKVKEDNNLGNSSLKILNNKEEFIYCLKDVINISEKMLEKNDNFSATDFCEFSEKLIIKDDSLLNKEKINIIETMYPELNNKLEELFNSLHEDTILGVNNNKKILVKHFI